MKFYLATFFLLIFIQTSYGQDNSIDGNKSELPKLKKESLQIETDVELYPNPAIDYLNIKLKNSQLKDVQFEIYNIIGNKLKFELDVVNSDTYKINVKEFHSGYYLLIIKDPISRYNKAFKFRK
ncbi:MAG: T9SS type A sorting domain-containing protein [Cyclobacteriaceae bacterium]|nr:T9SS type A sorting domain-containing protein [Cyclobacteriaceae bacterium]MCK5470995.1 T9SS type A sorting domain-containing protein [Cyclobacteriaceae bacterium]MCK5704234.1 T9SS type A sorting domain-containing protein [Cyclobacteriaceae bacterium]